MGPCAYLWRCERDQPYVPFLQWCRDFECPQCHGSGKCKTCNGTGQVPGMPSPQNIGPIGKATWKPPERPSHPPPYKPFTDLPAEVSWRILANFSQDSGACISSLDLSGLQHTINSCQYGSLSESSEFPTDVDSGVLKNNTDAFGSQNVSVHARQPLFPMAGL